MALDAFINEGVVQQIIGQCLGYRVRLGFMMTLNDVDFESISILHNGYFYIFLKYGALGLVLWYKALYFSSAAELESLLEYTDTRDTLTVNLNDTACRRYNWALMAKAYFEIL